MGVRGCWQNIETIDATIEWRRLTQAAAAEVLEVDGPKVSALTGARWPASRSTGSCDFSSFW